MSPEIAERLARVFPAPIEKLAVAAVAPVADVARYTRKPPELQPLQPLHIGCGEAGKTTREGLRCLIIDLHTSEIDALVRKGLLHAQKRDSAWAIREALYEFLDQTLPVRR
jgi:hypothetical protein